MNHTSLVELGAFSSLPAPVSPACLRAVWARKIAVIVGERRYTLAGAASRDPSAAPRPCPIGAKWARVVRTCRARRVDSGGGGTLGTWSGELAGQTGGGSHAWYGPAG